MEQRSTASTPRHAYTGAFHDYVRGVFAEQSAHSRSLRIRRARWLQRLAWRRGAEPRPERGRRPSYWVEAAPRRGR
jgi:hypothetical protein